MSVNCHISVSIFHWMGELPGGSRRVGGVSGLEVSLTGVPAENKEAFCPLTIPLQAGMCHTSQSVPILGNLHPILFSSLKYEVLSFILGTNLLPQNRGCKENSDTLTCQSILLSPTV